MSVRETKHQIRPPPLDTKRKHSCGDFSPRMRMNSRRSHNNFSLTDSSPVSLSPISSPRPSTTKPYMSARMSLPSLRYPNITEELIDLKERAIKLETLHDIDEETYIDLMFVLAAEKKKYALNKNYEDGEKINKAVNHVQKCINESKVSQDHQNKAAIIQEQRNGVIKDIDVFDCQTKEMIADLRKDIHLKRTELMMKHEQKVNEHEEMWKSDSIIKQYNRLSPELLSMKTQINALVSQSHFIEANLMLNEYNNLKSVEEKKMHLQMQHDFDESLKHLLIKQENELKLFEITAKGRMDKLLAKRDTERTSLMKRQTKIENQIKNGNTIRNRSLSPKQRINNPIPSPKLAIRDLVENDNLVLPPLDTKREERVRKMIGSPINSP